MLRSGTEETYLAAFKLTKDPAAAAMLVLADTLAVVHLDFETDKLEHSICMGIRHGLFGSSAPPTSTIDGLEVVIVP